MLYTLLCCLSFILLIVWFLFTEHEEDPVKCDEPSPKVPRPKKPKPQVVKEVIDECIGAVEDAEALQEELDTERQKMIATIRRRLKPSGASSEQDSTPL